MRHNRSGAEFRYSLPYMVLVIFWLGLLSVHPVQAEQSTAASPYMNGSVLTLDSCIEMALARNLTLAQSLVRIGIRDEEVREVRATAYPQLSVEANYTRLGNLTKIDFGEGQEISFIPEDNYLFQLSLTQLLYSGGQVQAALRLAKTAKQSVFLEKQLTEENIIMLVSLYFNQVLLSDELAQVAEETVDTVTAHLDIVRVMKNEGLASEYDLLRAEVELANVTPLLIQSRNRQRLAYARLENVIQWDGGDYSVSGAFDTETLAIDETALLQKAFENRWKLMIIEANKQMIDETVEIARGGYLPSLVFFGNYDWANDEIDLMTGEGQWNYGWNLGLMASLQLFDGFATGSRVAQARGNQKLIEYELEKLKNAIKLEITEGVNNYREAYELIQSQKKNVEHARKGLLIAEVRFREGISTQLEVKDSRTALTVAQSRFALAQHNFSMARIMLDKATGVIRATWLTDRSGQASGEQEHAGLSQLDSSHEDRILPSESLSGSHEEENINE